MAITRVGVHTGTNTTFASSVTTSSWTSTTGNLLIAAAQADTVAQNGITISDSKGNSWSRVISTALAATFDLEIWVAQITTGGASHTVTATDNGGGVDSLIIVEEWSGQATSSVTDRSAGATGTSSTALNSGATAATTQANEAVICAGVCSLTTLSAGSGYTNLTTVASPFSRLGFESKTVSATGAQTGTMTAGASASWVCQVATFKELLVASNSNMFLID